MKIRRPLCLAGLAYAAAAALAVLLTVRSAPVWEDMDRQQIAVAGYVDAIAYKTSQDGRRLTVTLRNTAILREDQISYLTQFLTDSDTVSRTELRRFWNREKEHMTRQDAAGIDGVICHMDGLDAPRMGSLVVVTGRFRAFDHAANPGEFDAADYYRIMGQQGRVMDAVVTAQSAACDGFRDGLYRWREYCALLIDACYDGTDADALKAMLLGDRADLDSGLKALYQQNGILHILAVSGLHLSVLGMGCYKGLRRLRVPVPAAVAVTVGLMYAYGVMTGMGVSMVRAYLMFALHLAAGLVGRTYDLLTALTVAALVTLVQQPLYVQHSGFLFSFGAVCGIGTLLPAVQDNLFGGGRAEKLVLSGVAVSLSTLPMYLCFYYEFPPYSVLLNLAVIPCMTLVLAGGLVSVAAAALWLPLGAAAAYPVHLLLLLYDRLCRLCLRLPGHRWVTGCPRLWQAVLFVLLLACAVAANGRLSKLQFWQCILLALSVLCLRSYGGLQITMADVGQGDCIYVGSPGRFHMLIDGGSTDQSGVADDRIVPFLKYEGISRLDAVVVTHPDNDHISGILDMLAQTGSEGVGIGTLYLPDVGGAGRNEAYRELERLAAENGTAVGYLSAGDRLYCGEAVFMCLHPPAGTSLAEPNAYSTTLYLQYGDFTALFTGDLEGEGERLARQRLEELPLPREGVTLLKVAHHGSGNSTGEELLRLIRPQIALISAGRDNRYGHPHAELLERLEESGCDIWRTQESGAVTVTVRRGRVRVGGFTNRLRNL